MKKLFLIAGEASGDSHGAALIREMRKQEQDIQIHAWGGEQMQEAGAHIEKHIDELSIMGFTQVIWKIRQITSWFSICKKQIAHCKPNAIVFIDFAGFNLRMAKWAKNQGYQTFYFIPPKTWAWNENRTQQLKKYVDYIIPIFPFEEPYFKSKGLKVAYFGNPLLEKVEAFKRSTTVSPKRDRIEIGLFPGSRKQELRFILPIFAKIIQNNPEYHFRVSAISSLNQNIYKNEILNVVTSENFNITYDNPYEILHAIDKAICTSGTITLEAALFKVPQIVVYRTNWLNYKLAKSFIQTPFISLPNLILDRSEIPELLQNQCDPKKIMDTLQDLNIHKMQSSYNELRAKLELKSCMVELGNFILKHIK